jgi:hypothetical protein
MFDHHRRRMIARAVGSHREFSTNFKPRGQVVVRVGNSRSEKLEKGSIAEPASFGVQAAFGCGQQRSAQSWPNCKWFRSPYTLKSASVGDATCTYAINEPARSSVQRLSCARIGEPAPISPFDFGCRTAIAGASAEWSRQSDLSSSPGMRQNWPHLSWRVFESVEPTRNRNHQQFRRSSSCCIFDPEEQRRRAKTSRLTFGGTLGQQRW